MNTTQIGRDAESAAAAYLEARGYTILDRNWRTRRCEIDLVAARADRLHIVEVKYRASAAYGDAVAYVTPVKQRQLAQAAATYVAMHHFTGDYQIDVVAITGRELNAKLEYYENVV